MLKQYKDFRFLSLECDNRACCWSSVKVTFNVHHYTASISITPSQARKAVKTNSVTHLLHLDAFIEHVHHTIVDQLLYRIVRSVDMLDSLAIADRFQQRCMALVVLMDDHRELLHIQYNILQ